MGSDRGEGEGCFGGIQALTPNVLPSAEMTWEEQDTACVEEIWGHTGTAPAEVRPCLLQRLQDRCGGIQMESVWGQGSGVRGLA